VDDARAPPSRIQKDVTFVVTDVAGSTELWEWNAEVMDLALQLHDATLRTLLFQHKGHEVTTEGDSFTVVFHDAMDALHWCLHVQKASSRPHICLTGPIALPLLVAAIMEAVRLLTSPAEEGHCSAKGSAPWAIILSTVGSTTLERAPGRKFGLPNHSRHMH
jgi:hypothetical protein